jgi:dTDP-4-amino-4,6-dideoxygalactose transaminase
MSQSTEFIPYAKPEFGPEEEEAVIRVLRSGWLTTGPESYAFEQEFAAFIGVNHAVSVNSATSGLHLALLGLGVEKGDRVAVPDYTFTATAEVLRYVGAEPILIDCSPDSFQMDISQVEDLMRHKPGYLKAALPVHFGGQPCYPEFWQSAREKGLIVIEDCAHAFPVETPYGKVGNLGNIGVFSFYANKTITTGEGGMIVSNNSKAIEKIKKLRLHGIDRDAFNRFQSKRPAWMYDVVELGHKYNLPDVLAAIGRVQLKKALQLKQKRIEIAQFYISHKSQFPNWEFPTLDTDNAWHLFPVLTPSADHRNLIIEKLFDRGVGTSVHYIPIHRLSFWKDLLNVTPAQFPYAEDRYQREISLPIGPGLNLETAKIVMERLLKVNREVYDTFT